MPRLWSQIMSFRRERPAFSSAGPRWSRTKSRSSAAVKRQDSQVCVAIGSFCTVSPQIGTPSFSYSFTKRTK